MKLFPFFVLIASLFSADILAGSGDFTISTLGASNNTNTVFIETVESASSTVCSRKNLLRISDSDKLADKVLSIGLSAQAQGKKVEIVYSDDKCIDNGAIIQVIKIKR